MVDSHGVGTYPTCVATGDFDGDGRMDVAVTSNGLVSVMPGLSGGGFGANTDYTAGDNPIFVTAADLTGDGRLDLAVANAGYPGSPTSGFVSVLPGLAGGGFGARTDYGTGIHPTSIAIGDLNGDGRLDLAVSDGMANTSPSLTTVSIMLGLPGGGFGAATQFQTGAPPDSYLGSIAMGDLNGDGRQDLAVGTLGFAIVMLQQAGGGFTSDLHPASNGGYAVAIRDLDGDGRQDLITSLDSGFAVSRGLSDGSLDAQVNYLTVFGVSGFAIEDLNADGRLDITTANYGGPSSGSVSTWLGMPGGVLGSRTDYATAGGSVSVAIGDMNGDGMPDLVTANPDVNSLTEIQSQVGGGFAATPYYAAGYLHSSIAVGDMNGDGRPDVAVPNTSFAQASILLGQASGRLEPGGNYGPSQNARGVAMGDLNADGVPDLVVANTALPTTNPGTVSAIPGLPGGALGAGTDYPVGASPRSPVLADLDGDGLLDLAVANSGSGGISVLMGVSGGGFGARTDYPTGSGPLAIGVGDLDSDGRPDLAVVNTTTRTVSILIGVASGGLAPLGSYPTPPLPRNVSIADLNGDGSLDLAIASGISSAATAIGRVSVYLGAGNGAFAPRTDYPTGVGTSSVAAGDLDGDGLLDLATGNVGSVSVPGSVSVLMGLTGGGFGTATNFGALAPQGIGIADFTGDGRPDLALANSTTPGSFFGQNTVGVMPNLGAAFAVNHAPTLTAAASVSSQAGDPVVVMATATDADAQQTVTIGSTVAPPAPWLLPYGGMAAPLPAVTASRAGTSGLGDAGTYTITWTASDDALVSATATAVTTLEITSAVDRAPIVSAPPTAEGVKNVLLTFGVTASDPDHDAITSLTATGTAVAAGATFTANPDNLAGTLSWTPGLTQDGAYSVTFTASNALAGSATTDITITDTDPEITAPPSATAMGGTLLTVNVTASDPDGDPITSLTATGTAITAGATFTPGGNNETGTLSWTPTLAQAGSYSVTFEASNALSASATTSITVTNHPPQVTAPSTVEGVTGEAITFGVSAFDPDGDSITSFTLSSGEGVLTPNADNTAGTYFTSGLSIGTHNVTFIAANTASGSATTVITVWPHAPELHTELTATGAEGALFTYVTGYLNPGTPPEEPFHTVVAFSPDGAPILSLTATGSAIDAGATFSVNADKTGGDLTWTPSFTQAGTYTVTYTASTGGPSSSSITSTITILNSLPSPPLVASWGTSGSGPGQFQGPYGVALNAAGNVYVTDYSNNRVQVFTGAGGYITQWGANGTGNGQFGSPTYVATDGSGNVYVTEDNQNHRLQKFASDGTYLTQWGALEDPLWGSFVIPTGVAVTGAGDVLVADRHAGRVVKFTNSGGFIAEWRYPMPAFYDLPAPEGLAVDAAGNVYMVEINNQARPSYGQPKVAKLTSNGGLIRQWGYYGMAPGNFTEPYGAAVDANGNVYVVDSGNNRIQVFDGDGGYVTQWGTLGSGPGEFNSPRGIAVDAAGNTYVADFVNNRVQKFGPVPGLAPVQPPVVTAPGTYDGAEGSPLSIQVTASDPDADPITSLTAAGTAIVAGAVFTPGAGNTTGTLNWTPTYAQAGSYSVTFTASNALSASATTAITIANVNRPPVVTISAPSGGTIVAMGTTVTFSGSFTDDAGETHTATWTFDTITTAGIVNETTQSVTATHTFTAAGVYNVSLRVTDNSGAFGIANTVGDLPAMLVVYDPTAGFVTGNGWIDSPAGAYPADPSLVGRANLGFVSKYKKGASTPTGETEFVFSVAGLTFQSSVYEWLVISGAKAQYKGSGVIGGEGNYKFMLTAIDGQLSGGGGVDKFRMKIWDSATGTVAYDNQPLAADGADPVTVLGGGSIAIKKNGGAAADDAPVASESGPLATRYALLQNSPNPFNPETVIGFEIATPSAVRIRVFSVSGRLVATLVDDFMAEGRHTTRWNGRTNTGAAASSGEYFLVMDAGGHRDKRTIVLLK